MVSDKKKLKTISNISSKEGDKYEKKLFYSNYNEWLRRYNLLHIDDKEVEGDILIMELYNKPKSDLQKAQMVLLINPLINVLEERRALGVRFMDKIKIKMNLTKLKSMRSQIEKEMEKQFLSKGGK